VNKLIFSFGTGRARFRTELIVCLFSTLLNTGRVQPRRETLTTVKTQIEDTGARTLELPLLVRRLVYSFCFVSTEG
jgi:hypothetical protein